MQSLHSRLWKKDLLKFEATPKLLKLINGGQNKKQGAFKFATSIMGVRVVLECSVRALVLCVILIS